MTTLYIIGALSIGLAVLIWGLVHSSKARGREQARNEVLKQRAAAVQVSKEVDDAVAGRSMEENRERLKEWVKN